MMAKLKFSERVDFTYIIGAGISLIFFNLSMLFYKGSGYPMMFSLVSLFSYAGVIIRGIIDRNSWGKTQKQLKISAFVGFISLFIIFSIESVSLLTQSFELSKDTIKYIIIFGGIGIILLYIILYTLWFRKMTYQESTDSKK
jgi:hypothetical protein